MEDKIKPQVFKIEELQIKYNTPSAIYEGAKAQNGWRAGRVLSEDEYLKSIEQFKKAPTHGRKAVNNVTKRR